MTSILVIEDDPSIRAALERGLAERGHTVQSAATGIAGLEAVLGDRPDLVLLDLGLPDVEGMTVIGMIRAASTVPIIVITAVDDDPTMVGALDSGADDYVVKPFRLDQVTARIRAVMRRTQRGASTEPIRVGELAIHEPTRTATLAGEELELARREFDLLLALAAALRRGRQQAHAARRGLAAGRRRLRAHRRRTPVVAASQARRDRGRAALPGERARGRRTPGRPGRHGPHRPAFSRPPARPRTARSAVRRRHSARDEADVVPAVRRNRTLTCAGPRERIMYRQPVLGNADTSAQLPRGTPRPRVRRRSTSGAAPSGRVWREATVPAAVRSR